MLGVQEQFELLKGFTSFAVTQCLMWQKSNARSQVTSKDYLHGQKMSKPKDIKTKPFSRVTVEFLEAFQMQNMLFEKLEKVLKKNVPEILGKEIETIHPNANHRNFGFRSLRLKLADVEHNYSDYLWEIYFTPPYFTYL